jgi:hypothetical protein
MNMSISSNKTPLFGYLIKQNPLIWASQKMNMSISSNKTPLIWVSRQAEPPSWVFQKAEGLFGD